MFFELLPRNQTINLNVYCWQLDSLNESIIQKHPELVNHKGVVFHHDNARPHHIHHTRLTLRRQTSTCFALFKTLCVVYVQFR